MSRRQRPWWHKANRVWRVWWDGRQRSLGVRDPLDESGAWAAFERLRARGGLPDNIADMLPRFLDSKRNCVKPKTLEHYARNLNLFLATFGRYAPGGVTGEAVADDCARRSHWSNNHRRNYLCAVEMFLRWCGVKITLNKPGRESAGAESVIREEVHWQAVGAAWGDLKPLLRFLWHTGCRPSEATGLTAEVVDWEAGTVRLRVHKTRGTGRDRLIYLSPDALAILQQQRDRRTGGLLFRNRLGRAWRDKSLAQAMWRISARIGERVTAYGYRHTYATRALARGVPDVHVAALLGHGSTRMIHAHYSHLSADARLLKDAAAVVSRAG